MDFAEKGIGNSIVMLVLTSVIMLAVFLLFFNSLLGLFGATEATLRTVVWKDYYYWSAFYDPFNWLEFYDPRGR